MKIRVFSDTDFETTRNFHGAAATSFARTPACAGHRTVRFWCLSFCLKLAGPLFRKFRKMCTFTKMSTFLRNEHIFVKCAHFIRFHRLSGAVASQAHLIARVGEYSIGLIRSRIFYFWPRLYVGFDWILITVYGNVLILEMCLFSENVHIFWYCTGSRNLPKMCTFLKILWKSNFDSAP